MSNAVLLKRTITQDGTLLKPSKPVTAVDSEIAAAARAHTQAESDGIALESLEYTIDDGSDGGHLWSSFSAEQPHPAEQATSQWGPVSAYYFLSFMRKQSSTIRHSDFYPVLSNVPTALLWRAFDSGTGCVNGAAASSCVSSGAIEAPSSDFTNTTGGTQYAPALTTVWPNNANCATVFLGELTKYIAISTVRFTNVTCTTAGGVTASVHGAAGEVVPVTLIKDNKVLVVSTTVPASGVAKLAVP
jgi:hypothetical protein